MAAARVLWALVLCGCGEHPADPTLPALVPRATPPPLAAQATLKFAGFSAVREIFSTKILPLFASDRRPSEQRVAFVELYQGSGMLTQSIMDGFAADVAILATADDVERLVRAGLVGPAWRAGPYRGIVSHSLVVLAVRKGNPKAIHDWSDLVRPGVAIVTPDPRTSGGGRWNVCAIYGAALRGQAGVPAGDPAAAQAFLGRVLANVVERRSSATASFSSFLDGVGDVAITYESELIQGWNFGHQVQRVIPRSTLLVENPAVVVGKNADAHGVRAAAEEFRQYLWSDKAQSRLALHGLRPVVPEVIARAVHHLPRPADLWTIEALGGWEQAVRQIFVPAGLDVPAAPPGR